MNRKNADAEEAREAIEKYVETEEPQRMSVGALQEVGLIDYDVRVERNSKHFLRLHSVDGYWAVVREEVGYSSGDSTRFYLDFFGRPEISVPELDRGAMRDVLDESEYFTEAMSDPEKVIDAVCEEIRSIEDWGYEVFELRNGVVGTGQQLYIEAALKPFREVDNMAGVGQLLFDRVWNAAHANIGEVLFNSGFITKYVIDVEYSTDDVDVEDLL